MANNEDVDEAVYPGADGTAEAKEKFFQALIAKGFVEDSGQRRRNPDSGQMEIVWQISELGIADLERYLTDIVH
jgi:hypothetical protein